MKYEFDTSYKGFTKYLYKKIKQTIFMDPARPSKARLARVIFFF